MARITVTIPEELARRAREEGINFSQATQRAVVAELDRIEKQAELDAYLAEQDALLGPPTEADIARAEAWADRVFGPERAASTPV